MLSFIEQRGTQMTNEIETITLKGRTEWQQFLADNADALENKDDALIAAMTDGLMIGGGAGPMFCVRLVNEIA